MALPLPIRGAVRKRVCSIRIVSAERVCRASSALAASLFRSQPLGSGVAEKAVFKPIKRQPGDTASAAIEAAMLSVSAGDGRQANEPQGFASIARAIQQQKAQPHGRPAVIEQGHGAIAYVARAQSCRFMLKFLLTRSFHRVFPA
jgi:hypothetical protein